MSETFTTPEQGYLQSGRPRFSILLRLDATSGPLRFWNGVGDLQVPADAVEAAPAIYSGCGQVIGIPALQALINGVAERVTFTLSGVPPELLAYVDGEASTLRFAKARVGIFLFDEAWQLASTVKWLWQARCDTPMLSERPAPLDGQVTRTISISVGTNGTGRTRPQQSYVTQADQARRSPSDLGMSRVVRYNAGATRKWPNYT